MDFAEVLEKVTALLQHQGRVSYRALKLRFQLDEELLAGITDELIDAQRLARDEDGKVLVWLGQEQRARSAEHGANSAEGGKEHLQLPGGAPRSRLPASRAEGERRQLTVMFCDLVDSTALSTRLDPEDLREVLRRYQDTCTEVIQRFDGYIAQYLGDGLLVYFGYPQAHEDDAARAVRAGLEIISSIRDKVPSPLAGEGQGEGEKDKPLQIRIGIHTGPVVISEIGSAARRESLALGETPNIAARVQGQATPQTVVISAATQQLVHGLFACQELGTRPLKGIATPLALYQVVSEAAAHSRFDVAIQRGLTPLVGREHEVGLLSERWARAEQAEGQVVLLSGEPGIGKSRLVQVMREHAENDAALRIEFRCSPYHQNSAFYPIIEHLQRLLAFAPQDSATDRLGKLEQTLTAYRFPQADTVPLLAALLSLPHPTHYPALTFSPQRQKQKTQEVLVAWLVEEAERHALYCPWEDLHWADPSTLEVLTVLLDHVPTARLYLLLTFRPEFTPPWATRSHISHVTLSRLGRGQATQMVERIAGERLLPAETLQQIIAKTDGVPLFVEELTKMVVESGDTHNPTLPHAIPTTLQDSLMARLDRLGTAKEIAQLGATIGREFSHELLQAISPVDEETLQKGLSQLVNAELIYQRGVPPHKQYMFKHVLIQDAAYQSLLKSRRQQLHQQIAQALAERFSETEESQPELLAHHYTEAGLVEQAIPYWQQAGQKAVQRSAHVEATGYFNRGLEVLKTLPDTPERTHQELTMQLALGASLLATKGYTVPEVGNAYSRARELCQQIGETPELFSVLMGLFRFYSARAEHQTARELAEQLLALAERAQDRDLLLGAHFAMGGSYWRGEFVSAQVHCLQVMTLYHPQQHRALALTYGVDFGTVFSQVAFALWYLGYAEQALKNCENAITLIQEQSHPHSLALTLHYASWIHQYRGEGQVTQRRAEELIALANEHGFPFLLAWGTMYQGWARAQQGQEKEGIAQIRQGLAASQAMGAGVGVPYWLALLAELNGKVEQVDEGLSLLTEALMLVDRTGERFYEAELHRLKGELTLQKSSVSSSRLSAPTLDYPTPSTQGEAEGCFLKAIEVAQKQQAKSLELRASTSLARLWQQQGKRTEAHKLLSAVYTWFTEGFDTKDLQEAKALLRELEEARGEYALCDMPE